MENNKLYADVTMPISISGTNEEQGLTIDTKQVMKGSKVIDLATGLTESSKSEVTGTSNMETPQGKRSMNMEYVSSVSLKKI